MNTSEISSAALPIEGIGIVRMHTSKKLNVYYNLVTRSLFSSHPDGQYVSIPTLQQVTFERSRSVDSQYPHSLASSMGIGR